MAESTYFLVRASSSSFVSSYVTLSEVAYHCGLHPELIERLVRLYQQLDNLDAAIKNGSSAADTGLELFIAKIGV